MENQIYEYGVEKIWTLIKRENKRKQTKKQTNRTYLFYISLREEVRSMHPLCCGRGLGYFS